MAESVCVVTGGAGFIGCALSAGLAQRFNRVVALDKLHPQVHARATRPDALNPAVEFRHADVAEAGVWDELLRDTCPAVIVHLAAETGTGQSLTEASRHARENVLGTTVMLDALVRHDRMPTQIVLSASRAVYGEGAWSSVDGKVFYPGQRDKMQLAAHLWDFPEAKHLPFSAANTDARPTSVYGATKLAQEHILRAWALAFSPKLSVLRLQNVYGPGQSLTNPYTGIVSLFCRLAREGRSIPLYEDGQMLRDFVYIDDVVSAILATIDAAPQGTCCIDIGSGEAITIGAVADALAKLHGAPAPHVTAQYRYGDVRHASCDLAPTLALLPWRPEWPLRRGLAALCAWMEAEIQSTGVEKPASAMRDGSR